MINIYASDVVALASILFWTFFLGFVFRKYITPIIVSYCEKIDHEMEDLKNKKEMAERQLVTDKNLFETIETKILELKNIFNKESAMLAQQYENQKKNLVKNCSEMMQNNKRHILEKETQKFTNEFLLSFDQKTLEYLKNKPLDFQKITSIYTKK